MSEVNHNAASFNSESIPHQSDRTEQSEVTEISKPVAKSQDLPAQPASQAGEASTSGSEPLAQKMNWQKVAHKLREHNRKLYKNIFRLEQELAELDNKFNKYVEKSQSSDLLLAQQAEEIEQYQENIALLTQQLTSSQQQIENRDSAIEQLSERYELSQKQVAQFERECTLLQEQYNHQAFELAAKERENQELQVQLSQQQRHALQQEAELKRYRDAEASRKKAISRQHNYPHNKFVQPWSTSAIAEPKIALPKSKSAKTQKTVATVATAKIAAKSAIAQKRLEKTNTSQASSSARGKKPQTLAAVELPTFPKHN